jgi:integrase
MRTNNFKIFPRTDATKKDGKIPIYLRLTINRHPVYFSLQVSISHLSHWDDEKNRIRRNSITNHFQDNNTIEAAENRARAIIQEYKDKFKPLTHDEFRSRFVVDKKYDKNSFYDFCTKEIAYLKTARFGKETIRTYYSYVSKMKAWRPKMSFSQINDKMRRELNTYMIRELGNMENTRQKMFAFIKSMLNRAIVQGIIDEMPFKEGAPAKKRPGRREFLTLPELHRLEALLATPIKKYQMKVLKYFLFTCYTGLRYQDLKDLRFSNIVEINGKLSIRLFMHKTKDEVIFSLTAQAQKLLPERFVDNQNVFNVNSDQVTNRYIKELLIPAGINKKISMHCARHTFATLAASAGIPPATVQKILGHRQLVTTMIYYHIVDQVKSDAIQTFEKFIINKSTLKRNLIKELSECENFLN